ncbi:hypothetical protein [Nonomuraea guangzhouensis]|uniref:DUF5709 domain-containing protein n=1 Tax=Nonomuraea guangzhouensis TaxID=1291555 RepID=A0ABW4GMD0_9ACTN|nr:hypothetical protein [Nonomuraea guangzhouensis]
MSEMDVRGDDLPFDEMEELPVQAPEADAAEQLLLIRGAGGGTLRETPLEVDPADAAEQAREVDLDDDDYR